MRDVEIPKWLKGLPLAPEFYPTDTEFADPIAYISKIEKEASAFGICKVIPPLPKPSKKYVLNNLNKTLSKCPELGSDVNRACSPSKLASGDSDNDGEVRALFTTRQQELGLSIKKNRGAVQPQQPAVQKQVWQSGEVYTLEQFESKSKAFARSLMSTVKEVSPLIVEAMFWKATSEKPIYLEYANDVPGSGFGEPEGLFRYFNKRRRKRIFKKNCGATSLCRKHEVDAERNSHNDDNSVASNKNDPNLSFMTSKATSGSSTLSSDETLQVTGQKSSNASCEMEGTAGWKLSNSPWNLQVIARSPGSLTRFMPDDIPGVTSPMVYIGMLFSWFAWHVEDHELHSLNFLHTGSPKTWYAVPGEYAFTFEEVIRTQAYGGDIDRLAGLKLLGEKTTLLSPEVVVASEIPCCRLIQHPGEFVVTFPRAYHVGFSHGFNCGEAANFGTPQWLQVAKDAAVRRAAMNYLPMLSHQQLLYLLTMSFVSRVPRSLLPGARSSRLRDRQKEERELSVKKAFLEDVLNENKLLTVLLGKEPTYRAVLWDPDSLPSSSKESQLPSGIASIAATPKESIMNIHPEDNKSQNNLLDEMSHYMENLNDLYLDDDDLSCDFQVDSGTLACVACGILGFPFMSVVQPSERASKELLPADYSSVQEGSALLKSTRTDSSSDVIFEGPVSENLPPVSDYSQPREDLPIPSTTKVDKGWNAFNGFLRPRIFCLEHAIQIEELLQSKGGANVLIICHSDYQKMKAHAMTIAEEIGFSFNNREVLLETASEENLNLINLAIDEEEHDECGEDWTSKLAINLRYCVKNRKSSPSKQVQHALKLGALFCDTIPVSSSCLKWQSRKSRSKFKLNHSLDLKPCEMIQINKDENLDGNMVRKEQKIIQYSRRNSKLKSACSAGASEAKETLSTSCGDLNKHGGSTSKDNLCSSENTRSDAGLDPFVCVGKSEMHFETQAREATSISSKSSVPALVTNSLSTETSLVESVARIENQTLENMNVDHKADLAMKDSSGMQNEMKITEESKEKNATTLAEIPSSLAIVVPTVERSEMQREKNMGENEVCILVTQRTSKIQCDMQSDSSNPTSSHVAEPVVEICEVQMENKDVGLFCMDAEVSDCGTGDTGALLVNCDRNTDDNSSLREVCATEEFCDGMILGEGDRKLQEIQSTTKVPVEELVSSYVTLTDQCSTAPLERRSEVSQVIYSTEELLDGMSMTQTDQPATSPISDISEARQETPSADDSCNGASSDKEVWEEIQTTKGSSFEEPNLGCGAQINHPTASAVENSKVIMETSTAEDFANASIGEPVQDAGRNQYTPASNGESSEAPMKIYTGESLFKVVTSSNKLDQDTEITNECYGEDPVSRSLTLMMNQPSIASEEQRPKVLTETSALDNGVHSPSTVEESSNVLKGTFLDKNLHTGGEVCLTQDISKLKITESTGDCKSTAWKERKRKRKTELEQIAEDKLSFSGFIKSPCEGLRPRTKTDVTIRSETEVNITMADEKPSTKKVRKQPEGSVPVLPLKEKKEKTKGTHSCNLDGCKMRFKTKAELHLHKRNRCPHPECGKRFSSHKYAMLHERVHEDERPLKCPWKGCTVSFKWAWARTEHLRVHTGERPYHCKYEGCGLSFRFISDFSRHRRKTGHHV